MGGKLEFIQSTGKIVVFVILVLSIFLFTVKTKRKLPNQIFGFYLLVVAFDLIGLFTNRVSNYPNLEILKISSSLLQMPLFYIYVLSVSYTNFKLRKRHLIHSLLFLTYLVVFKATAISEQSYTTYEAILEIQFLIYIIAVFIVLKRYKTLYDQNYSNTNQSVYKWLFQFTILSCIGHSFVLIRWFLSNSPYQAHITNINLVISAFILLVVALFVLKALKQPELFNGVDLKLSPIKKVKEDSTISTNHLSAIKRLKSHMKDERPYLDFELTLQKLAIQMDLPERELSLLINHHLGQHFFDFINEYRVAEAQSILSDPKKKEVTVLEILYQVGFNSKSSFYTAFKKVTGKTPTQFKKQS